MFSEQTFYFWRVFLDLDNFCLGICVFQGGYIKLGTFCILVNMVLI